MKTNTTSALQPQPEFLTLVDSTVELAKSDETTKVFSKEDIRNFVESEFSRLTGRWKFVAKAYFNKLKALAVSKPSKAPLWEEYAQ